MIETLITNHRSKIMALSAIPNAPLAKTQESQQKPGTATDQSANKRSDLSSDSSAGGSKFGDNVELSQKTATQKTQKTAQADAPAKPLDAQSAEELLQRTIKTSMADSKTAVSAQSGLQPQVARSLLADG